MQQAIDFTGKELMEQGMARAIAHAEAIEPMWSDTAYQFLLKFAATGNEFMAEDVRAASQGIVPPPPSMRAWGGIIRRAAKAGLITRIGYKSVINPKAHCALCSVWILKNE